MNQRLKKLFLGLTVSAFLMGGPSAEAGNPIGDFFKRLGNSIAHPTKKAQRQNPQKSTAKSKGARTSATVGKVDAEQPPPAPQIEPPPATPAPTPVTARSASSVPETMRRRKDIPYGIPVPNKPGFVTSPYAPNLGFVDVRGFPSGTEVKDPYTGKIFLTP